MAERAICHIVTHVHWDREWYRPFEAYRTRLVELVEQVCRQLDAGAITTFHLDGQTITLRDVGELRPDLVDEVRRHVRAGRLTIGPWHVLADNQLVSGENLVRNLLAARRHSGAVGAMTSIGYSPDAFGHPADLPRILTGFGLETALVWRGAPAGVAEFRWRSPDGSEVYAVNQAYYEVDVLWSDEGRAERLDAFLEREHGRREGGPWLLMNGADHVAPRDTTRLVDGLAVDRAELEQSTLDAFFRDLRAAHPEPEAIGGELRHLGGPGTFLLSGTLSTRVYLKQQNAAAEAMLERVVEPLLAGELLSLPSGGSPDSIDVRTDATPIDGSTVGHLQHAWELVLENAPHDSICGCSVDEVHRENEVRSERVMELGDQLVRRALLRRGFDPRVHGAPATESTRVVVHVPLADSGRRSQVTVDVTIAPDRVVTGLSAPGGADVPVEVEDLGTGMSFEADLDLLPDSVLARRQRLRFAAVDVEPGGFGVFTVRLGEAEPSARQTQRMPREMDIELSERFRLRVAPDASFSIFDRTSGVKHDGLARLVDGGDRGDTYTYDPPSADALVHASADAEVEVERTPVRTIVRWRATLDLPVALDETRDARAPETTSTTVAVEVVHRTGDDELNWTASFVNTARDHRVRAHFPIATSSELWRSGQHYSSLDRRFGPELGKLPTAPNREAEIGTHPAHGYAMAGAGEHTLALLLDHVSEVQGIVATSARPNELAVTLLRSTGWLSRFDLRTRTTGAGPMLETPEAQVLRPVRARIGLKFGPAASDAFALADAADARRSGIVAMQLREGTTVPLSSLGSAVSVTGAVVSALKPADDGRGAVLRLSNPSPNARSATVRVAGGVEVSVVRLDETPAVDTLAGRTFDGDRTIFEVPLAAQSTASLRLVASA
ncbi:glycoside hydrolase family 38 C-terminal domain-containing protein [Agromyces subbeticus]|uniref:glycoside hydrolase family 38 N-terminal domain-containing protein n=1 Tax=Agromyces subbeticus TaxID=293890 RepID=UPI0003B7BAE5|nr:glycoside hydrolase family 38 C-terminal domain-containing protein [Agromyces subbeticus]